MTVNQIQHQYAVGILTNHLAVQQAIQALEKADFPLQQVSIIAKQFLGTNHSQKQIDSSNYASPRYSAVRRRSLLGLRQGANKGALTGLVLGSITGILVGTATVAIPLIGPIMLAEAMTTTLVTTLAGSGMGVVTGGIVGSLVGLVIPKQKDSFSSQQWQYGDYLVIVKGTEEDLRQVNSILGKQGIEPWKTYSCLANTDFSTIKTQTPQPQAI